MPARGATTGVNTAFRLSEIIPAKKPHVNVAVSTDRSQHAACIRWRGGRAAFVDIATQTMHPFNVMPDRTREETSGPTSPPKSAVQA